MRNIILSIVFLLLTFSSSFGQISVNRTQLDFGKVITKKVANQTIILKNEGSREVTVQTICSDGHFTLPISTFDLESGESKNLEVQFSPNQNLLYNAELLISTDYYVADLSIDIKGEGDLDDPYYKSTFDLSEELLKAELKSIISKSYVSLGYNTARDHMYATIDNVGGNVTCVYTGRTAKFSTRSEATNANFNCEHTWPQSLFNSNEPEKSDIHHLFPTYSYANSQRGNLPFDVVSDPTYEEGGAKRNNIAFEPRDEHKGDVSRSMFYFAIRHSNYSSFLNQQESILRKWYQSDTVSQKEIDRNNAIYGLQKNRNPFVDHPEFLDRITSISSNSKAKSYANPILSRTRVSWTTDGETFDDTLSVYIANEGNTSIDISNVQVQKGYLTSVGSIPNAVTPGESAALRFVINYDAILKGGEYVDSLKFELGGANYSLPIDLMIVTIGVDKGLREAGHIIAMDGYLKINSAENAQLRVVDVSGREIFFNDISSSFTELSTINWTSGVYIAVLKTAHESFSLKFILP
jgi:endonuclease I